MGDLTVLVYFPVSSPVHTFHQLCNSGEAINLTKPRFPHLCNSGDNSTFLED